MTNVIVEKESDDALRKEEWGFTLDYLRGDLVLEHYLVFERSTKRHKYRAIKSYYWGDASRYALAVSDVPLSQEIKEEALQKLVAQIEVRKPAND